jgi:CheY-like chemotaxis protein
MGLESTLEITTKRQLSDGRPAEVLLIDDNRGDAILASHAFKAATVATNLTVAQTGEAALDLLETLERTHGRLPDIILLDLSLPRMNGLDVLRTLKGDERFKQIPVIIMSNSGAGPNVLHCYRGHAAAYLIKPSDISKYREAISLIEKFFFILAVLPVGSGTKARIAE